MDNRFSQEMKADSQEFEISQPVINIGSHADNDILLSGAGILPFHATIISQDGKFQLITLGAASSILVDGVPLAASPASIAPQQRIDISNFSLFLMPDNGTTRVLVKLSRSTLAVPAAMAQPDTVVGDSPILVNVVGQVSEIDVEQTAYFDLEIINAGQIVAGFSVTLQGVPEAWVNVTPRMVNLNEGQRATVRVSVTPPRESSSTAGKHALQAIVQSPNYAGFQSTSQLGLTIRPYFDYSVGNLSPKEQKIHWRKRSGIAKLPISNHGNSPADFSVSAVDDENGCSFDFLLSKETQLTRQATLSVPAGGTVTLPIEITPLKQAMIALRSRRYHYTTSVQLTQQALVPQTLSGSVTSVPLIGWWTIMLTVALLLIGLFVLVQPRIYSFGVTSGKDVIEKGDTTRLEWHVSPFATRLNLSNVEQALNYGQTTLTVAPAQSTTYELVAGNWLSGLLGLDQKRTQTVLVVPPSPTINVFEVDRTEVAQGAPVTVRWSVTKADQAFLTIDEVVYELKPAEFSGERSVVLPKDALVILEAKNASGSELRSYFINVVPPNIAVDAYTVWVKPQASASLNPGRSTAAMPRGGKLFSPTYTPPDPNFPDKYVELVPDKSSDSGYRVEFYQPDRELAKGEQIMLEWNVTGVDNNKLQIAPFTEPLPARGAQPYFPQESMNFVMTAKSGDLEQLFMLPVKVFDGTPPTAPKIEFFRASPLKMVGEGNVEFAWSVSGEWTRIQIANGDKVMADYLNPQGFRTIKVTKSSTFILTAWNGTLSSAAPLEIVVDPALIKVGLYFKEVFPESGRFQVNKSVAVTMGFYDPLTSNLSANPPVYVAPKVQPTGQILVTDGVSICTITLPAKTCDLVFNTPDDPKEITASYSGDKVYLSASTDAPYSGYIAVIGSTVELTPTYYLLDKTSSPPAPIGPSISINSSPLKLDTGLYIKVKVTPQGVPLPAGKPGTVTLSICEQQLNSSGQWTVKPGTCKPMGSSTITLDSTGSQGQADLVLPSFPQAGTFALVLSFSADGFVPKDRAEFNVKVSPIDIYLSLSSCSNPKSFTGCEIGTSNSSNTKVTFDIRKTADDQMLSSQLTQPPLAAFSVFEVDGSTQTPWTCALVLVTEGGSDYHKLECTADFSIPTGIRSPVYVNFNFDNSKGVNYSMTPGTLSSPFTLAIKENTLVSLDSTKFLGIKVGQTIKLTSSATVDTAAPDGAVILTTTGFQNVTSIGQIKIISDQANVLGIDSGGCSIDTTMKEITIPSIRTDCVIFFKKTGTFTLSVSFLGDSVYYKSDGFAALSVSIAKQDGVTITWKQSSAYVDWGTLAAINPNTSFPLRLELGGPANFSGKAFTGQSMNVALSISSNPANGACQLGGLSGSFPAYTGAIDTSGIPKVDFSLRCDKEPMTISMAASLSNSIDFAFASGQITTRILAIADRGNRAMSVSFLRSADNDQVVSGNTLDTFFMGAAYTIQVEVYPLWADAGSYSIYTTRQAVINAYLQANPTVYIDMDSSLSGMIDTTKTNCQSATSPHVLKIPLDTYRVINDFGNPDLQTTGITDIALSNATPCRLVFKSGTAVTTASPQSFSFQIIDPNYLVLWSVTNSYSASGLDRQTVSISPSSGNYKAFVGDNASNISLDFTPQLPSLPAYPLNP
jgi:hypothetical protein